MINRIKEKMLKKCCRPSLQKQMELDGKMANTRFSNNDFTSAMIAIIK